MYFGRTFVDTSIAPPYHLLQSTAEPSLLSASLSSKEDDIVLSPCLRDYLWVLVGLHPSPKKNESCLGGLNQSEWPDKHNMGKESKSVA